jgi:hypothetical protein
MSTYMTRVEREQFGMAPGHDNEEHEGPHCSPSAEWGAPLRRSRAVSHHIFCFIAQYRNEPPANRAFCNLEIAVVEMHEEKVNDHLGLSFGNLVTIRSVANSLCESLSELLNLEARFFDEFN